MASGYLMSFFSLLFSLAGIPINIPPAIGAFCIGVGDEAGWRRIPATLRW